MKLLSTLSEIITEQPRRPNSGKPIKGGGGNASNGNNNDEGKTFISPLGYNASVNSPYLNDRWGIPHQGVDLKASEGTSLRSPAPGKVLAAGGCGTCGNSVTINHGNINGKEVITRYCHMSSVDVQVGTVLSQGQVFGKTGNTGQSDGPHLHFEIRENDMFVNPLNYISSFVSLGTDGRGDDGVMPIGKSYCSGSNPTVGGGKDKIPNSKIEDILPAGFDLEKLKDKFPDMDLEELKRLKSTGGQGWLTIYKKMVDIAADKAKKADLFKDE